MSHTGKSAEGFTVPILHALVIYSSNQSRPAKSLAELPPTFIDLPEVSINCVSTRFLFSKYMFINACAQAGSVCFDAVVVQVSHILKITNIKLKIDRITVVDRPTTQARTAVVTEAITRLKTAAQVPPPPLPPFPPSLRSHPCVRVGRGL